MKPPKSRIAAHLHSFMLLFSVHHHVLSSPIQNHDLFYPYICTWCLCVCVCVFRRLLSWFCTGHNNHIWDSSCNPPSLPLPPLWVRCDMKDNESICWMGACPMVPASSIEMQLYTANCKGPLVGTSDLPSLDEMILKHKARHRVNKVKTSGYTRYILFGPPHGNTSLLERCSNINVEFWWSNVNHLFQVPPADANATLNIRVEPGDVQSPVYTAYKELDFLACGAAPLQTHRDNNSLLSEMVHQSYTGAMKYVPLVGKSPLEMLAQIGLDKIQRDYLTYFLGLFFKEYFFGMHSSLGLQEQLCRLTRLEHIFEVVAICRTFLSIPHENLFLLTMLGWYHSPRFELKLQSCYNKPVVGIEKLSIPVDLVVLEHPPVTIIEHKVDILCHTVSVGIPSPAMSLWVLKP
uniref:Protein zwilch n=1 Tax=Eptatretus burgeri TaxID=7764 RepID=A0A8C4QII7_EPTBU